MNAAFSIFANIIVIRYEIFPMLIFLTFAMLLIDQVEILGHDSKKSTYGIFEKSVALQSVIGH